MRDRLLVLPHSRHLVEVGHGLIGRLTNDSATSLTDKVATHWDEQSIEGVDLEGLDVRKP